MKKLYVILISFFFYTLVGNAQVALNGAVEIFPYTGFQPGLVKGISMQHAVDQPLLRHIYMVDRNIVALTIDERSVINGSLIPYKPQEDDTIVLGDYHNLSKILVRNGHKTGYICGVNNNWLRRFNEMAGKKLEADRVANSENIELISVNDGNRTSYVNPVKVYRKTMPIRRSHVSQGQQFALRHEIYLVFEDELKPGFGYSLKFNNGYPFSQPVSFDFNDSELRSESIHVNLYGYTPADSKVAFLSTWLGDGGSHSYNRELDFNVVDVHSDELVYSGKAALKSKGNQPEYIIKEEAYNHNLTDMYALDFTELNKPGEYRIVVPGIGCSFNFEVSDKVWENVARLTMKGFLHQRSGIELGPPHTDYLRPRNMHPAGEITIHKCDADKFFGHSEGGGQTSVFERIQASILLDTEVPEAWGGWMDAGDFDQRMSHLYSVRRMMYLHEFNPSFYEKLDLNIPESGNDIPDILDEAAWCLDLYRRTQGVYEEGAISWWIESVEHPRGGEPSWLNSLPTALVPPTPRACYHYAATAAQMALALKKYNTSLSEDYLESALAAVNWADKNADAPDPFGRNPHHVTEAMAFVNLYRATGEDKWHNRLQKTLAKVYPNGFKKDVNTGNIEILVNYLLLSKGASDPEIRQQSREAVTGLATDLLAGAGQNTYGILKSSDEEVKRLVLPPRSVLPVVMAHYLTGERKFSQALSESVQYTMGANPMNRSYISGLGERWFIPYQHDWESNNMPAPAGIPTFGPMFHTETNWGWTGSWAAKMIEDAGLYPGNLLNWPFAEKCFNNAWIAPVNEFTVRHPMGEIILLTGYLAQEGTGNFSK